MSIKSEAVMTASSTPEDLWPAGMLETWQIDTQSPIHMTQAEPHHPIPKPRLVDRGPSRSVHTRTSSPRKPIILIHATPQPCFT
ncbi:hypothetical protein VTJ04DRAFT_2294 [Mycothermus thermophilus]|uniref:uncharacterized protein n=1 Tax=Humicola insolens TaxID=85995 RepID=UPI003742A932